MQNKKDSRISLTFAKFINFSNLLHAFYFPYRSILVSFDDNDVKVNYGFDPRITLDESATTDKNEVENLYGDQKYGAKKYDKKAKIPANTGASNNVISIYWVLVSLDFMSLIKNI